MMPWSGAALLLATVVIGLRRSGPLRSSNERPNGLVPADLAALVYVAMAAAFCPAPAWFLANS